jgi:hypothetical protein
MLLLGGLSFAGSPVDIKLTAVVREYCHVIRFPQAWSIAEVLRKGDALLYSYEDNYEFRAMAGSGSRFLVAGFKLVAETKYYTNNKYEIDLSDPVAPIRAATEEAWQSARAVSLNNKYLAGRRSGNPNPVPEFLGRRYSTSGEKLGYDCGRPSPDNRKVVLLSWTGKVDAHAEKYPFTIRAGKYHGKLYYDVFDTHSGDGLINIEGTYSGIDPDFALFQAMWLTDRYFLIPLGDHRERCLVCEFSKKK